MSSVDDLTEQPPSFSAVIREATWQDHESNEGSPFMQALLDGDLPIEGYGRLAAQQWFVYAVLEDAAEAMRADPIAGPFVTDELTRLPSIESDLRVLVGDDWSHRIEALPATAAYCDRIRAVCFEQPGAFVAHHYTRYMGDLSGGQHIARVVRRVYDLDDDRGAAFFHFAGIDSVKDFKDTYRSHLDGAPWTAAEKESVIAEVRNAYRLNRDLVGDLDATVA